MAAFQPVSSQLNVVLMEENVLRYWKTHRIFEKSQRLREGGLGWTFYEGPPTANGKPGVHHALARAYKDIFLRYRSLRGYNILRRGGWDTHGLPVEIAVEKQLGFTNKAQIEAYGIARFNERCRKSAFDYIQDWERMTDRLGYWVDLSQAYITYTRDYIESVWWILKKFWDRGLLYQGYKVVPYCPRCGTPLSDHEVALGYDEAVDPSIFVRLPLVDEPGTSLLVWTTTPWTLPGNVAVAAHPEVEYVTVERRLPDGDRERLILANALLERVFGAEAGFGGGVRILDSYKGRKLKGRRYQPLFTFLQPDRPAYSVILGEYVTMEDGTGLVHIAPAFGAEDMQAALENDLPVLMAVEADGTFVEQVTPWRGQFVKDADPFIIRDLEARGLLFRAETVAHTYPFCWRCSTPLLYYARNTWYLRTSTFKERLLALNENIHWVPEHIQKGRFGDWLENNVDWALGRERYWGTPLPVWECSECRRQLAVGSVAELEELAGQDMAGLDLHRPYVDELKFTCAECGRGQMVRVPELIDVWFDSGSMPLAQWHYPFENREVFEHQFPADFICEGVDQTRGWFYSLHAISSLLWDHEAYRNVIAVGLILDAEGQKMSKSRGNVDDPWEVFNTQGADAFRWYLYTASPPGQERRYSPGLVSEVVRSFTLTLWNVYSFFVTYANLDGWTPDLTPQPPLLVGEGGSELDRWLLSELAVLTRDVTTALDTYDVPGATRPVQAFVELLSNWYLRRSRRRFWKSELDADKGSAYATLYEALVTLSRLLAPAMPFLADALYGNLVRQVDPQSPESVHLAEWPVVDPDRIDTALNHDMRLVMKLASLGHAARSTAGIKVRQPLAEAAFSVARPEEAGVLERFGELLAGELNVKTVRLLGSAGEAVSYSLKPLAKQLGQKYTRQYPRVAAAIEALDAGPAALRLLVGETVPVMVDGVALDIRPEEVEVRSEAHPGLVVAAEGAYLAALQTELTPALVREGLARELVRRVQELRKNAGLEIADRIRLWVDATPRLAEAVQEGRAYLQGETLAVELVAGPPPEDADRFEAKFDGERVVVGIRKA